MWLHRPLQKILISIIKFFRLKSQNLSHIFLKFSFFIFCIVTDKMVKMNYSLDAQNNRKFNFDIIIFKNLENIKDIKKNLKRNRHCYIVKLIQDLKSLGARVINNPLSSPSLKQTTKQKHIIDQQKTFLQFIGHQNLPLGDHNRHTQRI